LTTKKGAKKKKQIVIAPFKDGAIATGYLTYAVKDYEVLDLKPSSDEFRILRDLFELKVGFKEV